MNFLVVTIHLLVFFSNFSNLKDKNKIIIKNLKDFNVHAELDKTENFGGLAGRGRKKQDPPIERDLMLSLEEVYHGCIKKMKISRRVMNDDGHTSSFREKILTITVKRGWKPGTRITFEQEGDQGPNSIPADIVFIVRDKPHSIFKNNTLWNSCISTQQTQNIHRTDTEHAQHRHTTNT